MGKYIKIACFLLVIASSTVTFGQTFGVKAGINWDFMYIDKYYEPSQVFRANVGYNFGATMDIPIQKVPNLSIETALLFSTLGGQHQAKKVVVGIDRYYKVKTELQYIQIPVWARYSVDVDEIKFYGKLGPYFGLGLAGKQTMVEFENGEALDPVKRKIKWGSSEEEDYRRFDMGINVAAGIQIESIRVEVSYGAGILNMAANKGIGDKARTRSVALSLMYTF